MKIQKLSARQILDSRGNPTIEVEVTCSAGTVRAMVPSGASTGVFEAKELRDGGTAWGGKGVIRAVKNVQGPIAKAVVGKNFKSQAEFDAILIALDGTIDKSRLGANALLGVSMAFCRAHALERKVPLYEHIAKTYKTKPRMPQIFANVINGGVHSGNGLPMQEFMLVPQAPTFLAALEDITLVYHELKKLIVARYGGAASAVGDEGGFAPPVRTADEALALLAQASRDAGRPMKFAMDAAASEFYDEKTKLYHAIPGKKPLRATELQEYYEQLIKRYNIVSLEDPFEEHAFSDFAALLRAVQKRSQIVGDDLTVTNTERVEEAKRQKSCNSLLLKVNQIGTVTEAVGAAQMASAAGWTVMVSHRSGETDDAFISHLVVGLGVGQAKIGAPARGERVAKYNELIRIAEHVKAYKPLL